MKMKIQVDKLSYALAVFVLMFSFFLVRDLFVAAGNLLSMFLGILVSCSLACLTIYLGRRGNLIILLTGVTLQLAILILADKLNMSQQNFSKEALVGVWETTEEDLTLRVVVTNRHLFMRFLPNNKERSFKFSLDGDNLKLLEIGTDLSYSWQIKTLSEDSLIVDQLNPKHHLRFSKVD